MRESVAGTSYTDGKLLLGPNGVEFGCNTGSGEIKHNFAADPRSVIIVADNLTKLIEGYRGGCMNTTTRDFETKELTVTVKFRSGVRAEQLGNVAPYNLFIFDAANRRVEIHKNSSRQAVYEDNRPTDIVDTSLFGTADDVSNINNTYISKFGLPWAFETSGYFNWPLERVKITDAYPKFRGWV